MHRCPILPYSFWAPMSEALNAATDKLMAEGFYSAIDVYEFLHTERFRRPDVPVPLCVKDWLGGQNFICSSWSAYQAHKDDIDLYILGDVGACVLADAMTIRAYGADYVGMPLHYTCTSAASSVPSVSQCALSTGAKVCIRIDAPSSCSKGAYGSIQV